MLLDKILEMLLYAKHSFNGHPPLGVNATELLDEAMRWAVHALFQWAPTLGGECYARTARGVVRVALSVFQWAPTLGGECYFHLPTGQDVNVEIFRFNGHPPLGVNATLYLEDVALFAP